MSPAATFLGDNTRIVTEWLGQALLWVLLAGIIGIVILWEKQPLSSLWLKPFQWQSVIWGGLFFLAYILFLFPVTEWFRTSLELPSYAAGMEKTLALPIWIRVIAVVTAGIVEETLFRAYAITRFASLSGSLWLAAVFSVVAFAALHLPFWGAGAALAFLVGGAAITAFFIWRRDLLAMIIAHIATDAWALVVTPLFSKWWK